MNTIPFKAVSAGLFLLFIFLFGFWLSRAGKPYPVIIFTIHKLITVGALIYLGVNIYQIHQTAPLSPLQMTLVFVTGLLYIATMISGALLSIDRPMPELVLGLHKVTPYLTATSTGVTLYLLLAAGVELPKI